MDLATVALSATPLRGKMLAQLPVGAPAATITCQLGYAARPNLCLQAHKLLQPGLYAVLIHLVSCWLLLILLRGTHPFWQAFLSTFWPDSPCHCISNCTFSSMSRRQYIDKPPRLFWTLHAILLSYLTSPRQSFIPA